MFGLFLEAQPDEAATYRFGREPDGTPIAAVDLVRARQRVRLARLGPV
jgi:hypothetical protein